LLSSTISIDSLVKRAKELNYSALAITDRNNLYGVLQFYEACHRENIKPIIGLTASIERKDSEIYPLILLARNNHGYKNLLQISTYILTSSTTSITFEDLKGHTEGLIAITPGVTGEIEQSVLAGDDKRASEVLHIYKN